ncbi:MAG: RNA 2'-phosphotransferase [Cardiobacteriaceae bacterium]|nr:RNA 2'-phosphotransferase [Cardiobacteriaceae bacterium]
MTEQDLNQISKIIALILRHKPEVIGIKLDNNGWANVDELIAGIGKNFPVVINQELLEKIVATDGKKRYSFNENRSLIRANQGHSLAVDVQLKKEIPPSILYHGTAEKYENSISKQGLIPKSRLYVHLSKDVATAQTVGQRHGKVIIYKIDSAKMQEDGFEFFLSENGVWLTKTVPIKYLEKL